ncbi:MAG: DUF411 domain-containing protein [Gammaproteobacteria bacterium]|nr:DUF411 domain-containing protein [Gammaproteobacteria bacterium]
MFWFGSAQQVYAGEVPAGSNKALPEITVYKSPTCGCCDDWVTHLETEGFKVVSHNRNDMDSIKKSLGVKPYLASCHTATIDGYVIEGHVPATDIKQLLREKFKTAGLTAPGMPKHSPGMSPPGEKPRGYNVLMFDKEGGSKIFTKY